MFSSTNLLLSVGLSDVFLNVNNSFLFFLLFLFTLLICLVPSIPGNKSCLPLFELLVKLYPGIFVKLT